MILQVERNKIDLQNMLNTIIDLWKDYAMKITKSEVIRISQYRIYI